jgi:GntR family transcriptional repressor for pyruvate dehydrogenase complex
MTVAPRLVLRQVGRRRLSATVAESVLTSIRDQNLTPGTKLPAEHQLMTMLQVGRSTVREALNGLAIAGVVTIRHGQGYYVAEQSSPPPEALAFALRVGVTQDLMEARMLIEPELAGMAASRATQDDLDDIARVLADSHAVLARGGSGERLGISFHQAVFDAAHNQILSGFVHTYAAKVRDSTPKGRGREPAVDLGEYSHHVRIAEAIRAHDADIARACMRDHLDEVHVKYQTDQRAEAVMVPSAEAP